MKKLKFLISLLMEENPYQRMQAIAGREVARSLGVDLQILFAKNDALIQSEQLLNAIHSSKHSELDGIVCAPVRTTRTALMQVARSAAAAGIGWAVLNRAVINTFAYNVVTLKLESPQSNQPRTAQRGAFSGRADWNPERLGWFYRGPELQASLS